jgi:acyl-CoA synthetase (AMP-forming)/AMP-acid ligase II
MADHPLSRRVRDVLALQPDAPAIEFEDGWSTWGQVADLATQVREVGVAGHQVGMLLRNKPAHVAGFLGVLLGGGTVVVVNPARGDDRIRADLRALDLPLVIGEQDDLTRLVTTPSTATVAISAITDPVRLSVAGTLVPEQNRTGIVVRMLTSGTTGPPKRIDLTYDMLAHSVIGENFEQAPSPTRLRSGVAIVNAPLVHIGGVFRVLQCVCEGRSFALLDRFELNRWADAVRRHRPRAVSLVPAALRTVLHSDLTRDDLAGIRAVTSGTAPLAPEDADAFTEKFGIPVLTSYAATEFGGGVTGWTLADYQRYWQDKRGSVGRASLGAQLRVVDDGGQTLGVDQAGVLEVKPGQLGPAAEWMRTTDMARIDADGFVWILGRADQAIIRGGFKIMPDDVQAALESHPAVHIAAVVAQPDDRLGETPVAMVELREPVDVAKLEEFLRNRLAGYELPTAIAVVEQMPCTPSGKPDLSAVREHFASVEHA